jgi:hypothetical protein
MQYSEELEIRSQRLKEFYDECYYRSGYCDANEESCSHMSSQPSNPCFSHNEEPSMKEVTFDPDKPLSDIGDYGFGSYLRECFAM